MSQMKQMMLCHRLLNTVLFVHGATGVVHLGDLLCSRLVFAPSGLHLASLVSLCWYILVHLHDVRTCLAVCIISY